MLFARLTISALLAAGLVLVAGCRTTASRHVAGTQEGIARLKAGVPVRSEADSLVQPLITAKEVYGMAVGVVLPDGSTEVYGYGKTGQRGITNSPDGETIFQIGSISKLFFTALLVQLIDEGRINWDDKIRDILPPDHRVKPEVGEITIYELATHTAGLPREPAGIKQLGSCVGYLTAGRNLYGHMDRKYLKDYLRKASILPPEQRKFAYSNFGMGILAYLVEVKTGRSVMDMIEERVCQPLGLTNSMFYPGPAVADRVAVGHTGNQACWKRKSSPMPVWDMGPVMGPSSGLYSTVNDLLVFAKAHLGQIQTPIDGALADTRRVRVQGAEGGQGLGWIEPIIDETCPGILYKHGMVGGYCSYIGISRESQVAVVVLSNTFYWDERVGHNLILRLTGAHAPKSSEGK